MSGLAAQAAWAAGWSLLVVYATAHLGLGPLGFGLLVVAGAAGGMLGVLARPALDALLSPTARVRPIHLVVACFGLEACGHAALALTHAPTTAGATVAALGLVGFVAGSLARDERLALTAADGSAAEVSAAVTKLGLAATVVGCLAGGVVAGIGGVDAAYWSGAVLLGLTVAALGRRMVAVPRRRRSHTDAAL